MTDDDERPVTGAKLKMELEYLRNQLEMERLQRQHHMMLRCQVAVAIILLATSFAVMICSIISRGIH